MMRAGADRDTVRRLCRRTTALPADAGALAHHDITQHLRAGTDDDAVLQRRVPLHIDLCRRIDRGRDA